jgi:uncharacterized protein DUF6625
VVPAPGAAKTAGPPRGSRDRPAVATVRRVAGPSIRLVVPYFGARPSYLPLVVRSMAANPDVEWLMLTDAPVPGAPANLTVQRWELADLVARFQRHVDVPLAVEGPYKLCDLRPAFGEVLADELAGCDFWGHCDLDVVFGRIRDHLPPEAFAFDKVLVQGNFALYRNTPAAAGWWRHEIDGVSHRDVLTDPAARHFDEGAGIYLLLRDLDVPIWQEQTIFDLSFARYRTRAEHPPGRDPRRYAWEDGEVCEYRVEHGQVVRRTALLVHLQKRVMRAPSADVLAADRYWIDANGFAVQRGVSPWAVRAARVPRGSELVGLYVRRVQRAVRRRAMRRARERARGRATAPTLEG